MKKLATVTLAIALFAIPVMGSAGRKACYAPQPAPVCQPVCQPACPPTCFNPLGCVGGLISGVGNVISGLGNCLSVCW